jgi:hypothetical protein
VAQPPKSTVGESVRERSAFPVQHLQRDAAEISQGAYPYRMVRRQLGELGFQRVDGRHDFPVSRAVRFLAGAADKPRRTFS